jgi:SHS2 domain-containing protein
MFGVMVDLDGVEPREAVPIACSAPDCELLLVEWLNALLAEADLRGMVFRRFEVRIAGEDLAGRAFGERFDPARHVPGTEVKGATLTALRVGETEAGFEARTVVDV